MKICVFGASSQQIPQPYIEEGERLGKSLAEEHMELIFGGGTCGMMGAVSRGARKAGGKITGVFPSFLDQEHPHGPLDENFVVTQTLEERKTVMESMADAFIAAPGSIGTLEEFFEVFTLTQFRMLDKPLLLWNANGFYTPLLDLLRSMENQRFLSSQTLDLLIVCPDVESIMQVLRQYAS